jgi:hypothetical protein
MTTTKVLGLHANQAPIFDADARFKVVAAGRRFGKTELAMLTLLTGGADGRGCLTEPGVYRYIAPTQKLARKTLWRRKLKRALHPSWLARPPHETNLEVEFVNGSILEVLGAEDPDSLRGDGVTGVVLDEYADMRAEAWPEAVRPSLADVKGWALFIGTPKSFNHFYDMYARGQSPDHPSWASWQYKSLDNPLLDPGEVDEARRTTDPRTFRQEWEASFEAVSGRAYYAFSRATHVRPVQLDLRFGPAHVTFDFNVHPATAVIWQRAKDMARVWREVYLLHMGGEATRACAMEAKRLLGEAGWRGAVTVNGDSAGASAKTTGPSDHAVVREVFGQGVSYQFPKAAPHIRDRVEAVNSRLQTADGLSHLEVDGKCERLIADFEQVTVPMLTDPAEKRKNPMLTHVSDAFGYDVHYEWPPAPKGGAAEGFAHWL